MRTALYDRVSTQDQHNLPLQIEAMRKYAEIRNWKILRQRVKAGIAQARKKVGNNGRPRTAALHAYKVKMLAEQGLSKAEIGTRLDISRASVMRILKHHGLKSGGDPEI